MARAWRARAAWPAARLLASAVMMLVLAPCASAAGNGARGARKPRAALLASASGQGEAEQAPKPVSVTAARAAHLQSCVVPRSGVGCHSPWAGTLLRGHGVVVGPLIPKAASSSLRMMFGDANYPPGRIQRDDPKVYRTSNLTSTSFHFAVVRDPIAHLIDGYKQHGPVERGYLTRKSKLRIGGGHQQSRGQGDASRKQPKGSKGGWKDPVPTYCSHTREELHAIFAEHVKTRIQSHSLGGVYHAHCSLKEFQWDGGDQKGRPATREGAALTNEHFVRQVQWLQPFYSRSGELVPVAQRLDALVHLESWDSDWDDMVSLTKNELIAPPGTSNAARSALGFVPAATGWLERQRRRSTHVTRAHNDASNSTSEAWWPWCGGEGHKPRFVPADNNPSQYVDTVTGERDAAHRVAAYLRSHYAREFIADPAIMRMACIFLRRVRPPAPRARERMRAIAYARARRRICAQLHGRVSRVLTHRRTTSAWASRRRPSARPRGRTQMPPPPPLYRPPCPGSMRACRME